ncbi:22041_t:CDS:10 [Gigaspora margarita]|uniref:22041_t:CDS:1 n=1 Tax=Gigaspora margarita TaxID=4874 RepID=A0ABN7UN79_GIGMA|nr:22041_t:CDS:10 [Gigaspora margarita]
MASILEEKNPSTLSSILREKPFTIFNMSDAISIDDQLFIQDLFSIPKAGYLPESLKKAIMAFADDSKKYSVATEKRLRYATIALIILLTAAYGFWNIYRMVESVNSPVVSLKSELRPSIRVPGLVICGRTLNWSAECYKSKFNAADDNYTAGINCNEYLSSPIDATIFVNMHGYDDLDKLYIAVYFLNTSQPFNESYGTNSLEFNSSTQKIAIELWSSEESNNTYGINKKDIIIGGGIGQTIQKSIESDETFTSFAISGFGVSKHLWEIFRIIPAKYVSNGQSNSTEYLVQLWINPWGVVQRHQRHLLKVVPPSLESYSSLTESIDPQTQEKDSPEESYVLSSSVVDVDKPSIQQIKQDLHEEVQKTIKSELIKLKRVFEQTLSYRYQ